jgi:hypothetical protein
MVLSEKFSNIEETKMDEPTSKQPSEKYFIEADFSKVWMSGDSVTLASSSVVAVNNADEDKTSEVIEAGDTAVSTSGKGLVIRVKAGSVAESPYKITAKIMTSLGNEWELDIPMVIFDE